MELKKYEKYKKSEGIRWECCNMLNNVTLPRLLHNKLSVEYTESFLEVRLTLCFENLELL